MPRSALYDRDFFAWANEQATLLREGKLEQADLESIAEEIESMGKTEKRELISRLTVLLLHLLKWRFQGVLRCNGWRNSIRIQRREIAAHLADNPSLKALIPAAVEQAYGTAVIAAETETGLDEATFPRACPWVYEQMMDADFWPER